MPGPEQDGPGQWVLRATSPGQGPAMQQAGPGDSESPGRCRFPGASGWAGEQVEDTWTDTSYRIELDIY